VAAFILSHLLTNLNNTFTIATLILAAGESSRMGTPKQLLKWKDSTILETVITNVLKSKSAHNLVILGAHYDAIQSKIENYNIETLYNEHWKKGLGNSLAFGIKQLQKNYQVDGVLIVLADQPLIDSDYLNTLINTFEVGKKQIIASDYGPDTSGEKLGVPALFDICYFEELSKLDNDRGAKKTIMEHIENVITVNASQLISDIDTMEDYERLYSSNH
jgi:molybdenum cofactor cytidylyltransferase